MSRGRHRRAWFSRLSDRLSTLLWALLAARPVLEPDLTPLEFTPEVEAELDDDWAFFLSQINSRQHPYSRSTP